MEFMCVADTDNGNTVDLDVEWLTPTTKYHILQHTGKLEKKLPDKFLTKPYETPAVESPHPGGFLLTNLVEGPKPYLSLIKDNGYSFFLAKGK
jgi:hypothetical protein